MGSFVENVNKLAANIPVDGWASLDEKVDKVAGKGLSTEDYTSLEKQKLYGIAEGATSNAGDAFLTDRKNHTGTQSIDTITESASLKVFTAAERAKLDAVSVHPEKHPVSIIYGLTNPSKFVKTDAVGNTGFSDVTWSDVQGKPSSFNPNAHQHSLSDLSDAALKADKTYVDTQLSAKADTSTLTIELAKKADLNIVATDAELQAVVETLQPLSQKGQANGYVPLDSGGKIPNSYLNNLSTIEVFTANSESNMLLLSNVSVGDQCIRTDLVSKNLFILTQTPATELTNWKQLNASASVLSVNGQIGVVNVSKSDVGLGNVDNTADVSKTVLSATKLATARTISLASDVTGSASFDGSGNISITATIVDNSHSHTLANISDFPSSVSATELGYLDTVSSNIQTQLNAKQATLVSATNIKTINGNSIVGGGDLVVAGGDMLKTTYDTTNNGIVDKTENLVGGNNTTLLGSIPYQSNTDKSTLLAPNTTTTRKFLRQTGSGTNGSAPVWDTILASDVPTLNQSTTGNAATATTANALNTANAYVGTGFTANGGALRAQNFGSVATNGITYYGNADSYIFKQGGTWYFNNEQGSNSILSTAGAIVTANGGNWGIDITGSSGSCTGNSATATNADKLDNYHLDALGIPLFRGFNVNGLHDTIGNLNTIAINSIYNCAHNAIGTPIAQWGFVHTMVHTNCSHWRTQMWYPMQNNSGTVYQRFMSDDVNWSAWASIGGSVGVGQSWQDVTTSRASGVTYTNSTGKPIFLAVFSINVNFTGVLNINGISITYTNPTNTAYAMQSVQIIVPHGNTYSVTFTDTATPHKWLELR